MQRDEPSADAYRKWLRSSLYGLIASLVAMLLGGGLRHLLRDSENSIGIGARIAARAVYGFGLAFAVLFLLLLVTGTLYTFVRRRR